jgi:tryptophan synthase alpha chain
MSRISKVFQKPNHKALIPYVTVGYPDLESTLRVVPLLADSGCDLIELGIPFSDPLADGTTIQNASYRALQNGVTPQICLNAAREISQKVNVPMVFMSYFNPILSFGLEKFCEACAGSGVDGLIIPDLPPEEGTGLRATLRRKQMDSIYLLAPTSTPERIRLVAENSSGFIYLVSVAGVTGARETLPADLESFVSRVKSVARLPLCVGFGISTPEQAGYVARLADGIIIGSRLIQLMESDRSLVRVQSFMRGFRSALDQPSD